MSNKAFRIKRYKYVDQRKWERLLEESLVPISDEPFENAPDNKVFFEKGDWLVEYADCKKPVYAYRVKSYRYEPHLHLYIKHFVEVDIIYNLPRNILSDNDYDFLAMAEHLEPLLPSMFDALNKYFNRMNFDFDERLTQLIFKLKLRRNILSPLGKEVLAGIEKGELSDTKLKEVLISTSLNNIQTIKDKLAKMSDIDLNEVQLTQKIRDIQWTHREKILFNLQAYNDYSKKNHSNSPSSVDKSAASITQPTDKIAYLSKDKRLDIVNEALDRWYKMTGGAKLPMDFINMSQLARITFRQGVSRAKFIDQLVQSFRKQSS